VWFGGNMETALQDLRYALRQLQKSPGFALTGILSLALGIGATTAVFSIVYAVLMDPYPYRASDRMVHLIVKDKAGEDNWVALTGPQFRELRQSSLIESMAGFSQWELTATGGDLPESVTAAYLTGNAFNHLGVPALLGRGLLPSDDPDDADPHPVTVLGHNFWQRRYGGSREVLGKTIQLDRKNYLIVGVAQPRFTWGDGDVYLPLKLDPKQPVMPMIRLKPGVSRAAANAEFQPLLEQFAKDTPGHFPADKFRLQIQGLNDQFVRRIGGTLYLLFAAVAALLMIGCGNVSILLLARGTVRQHELAVRAAIGASRFRIVRQLLTESLLLSSAGAGLGILLAYRAVAVIVIWLPEFSFPHEAAVHINVPVLCFSVALALVTGIVFGLSPALQLSHPDIGQVIQSGTRRISGGAHGKRTHSALIAGQVALTLLLLAGAAAAGEGFFNLYRTRLGYDPSNAMSVGIPVHDGTFPTWEQRAAYFDQLREKIASTPQVVMTAISTNATPPDNGWETKFEILGMPSVEEQRARINFTDQNYFSLLHVPLLQGRVWDQAETMRGAHVAVINQTLARKFWPDGDAVGQQMRMPEMKMEPPYRVGAPGGDEWLQVIGIVGDARNHGLREPVKPALYMPYTLSMPMFTQILVRAQIPPLTILGEIRAQIRSINPDQQVFREVRSLEQWITTHPEWARERLVTTLFGAFSVLALLLSAVGLYSVVSYSVAQRTNEFGIRMALGAQRKHVLWIVFASTAVTVGGGLLVGIVLCLGLNGLVAKWAEGSARDPVILLAVTTTMVGSAALACLLPARRASTVDPATALRYE
jgi:putative ABC transport system permease protein